jgi:hypothetical protein
METVRSSILLKGDTVLLSPACAALTFSGIMRTGAVSFKQAVRNYNLIENTASWLTKHSKVTRQFGVLLLFYDLFSLQYTVLRWCGVQSNTAFS